MNLTLDLLSFGVDERTFIQVGPCRITKLYETGLTDLYEVRMDHAKLVFVLGKTPKAAFRVIKESDTSGVLEVYGHCTSFCIECSYEDIYKFEVFMRIDVQFVCEVNLLGLIEQIKEIVETKQLNVEPIIKSSVSKAA